MTKADYRVLRLSALTLGQRLRNHPSVDSFQWSDNAAHRRSRRRCRWPPSGRRTSTSRSFPPPSTTAARSSAPSGEKEGPYDWVPPAYWYDTTHYLPGDSTRTNVGGAWAYDSEQSAGNTIPTLDSINRFMSPHEQAELWQNPSYNQYHANYEGTGHHGYYFGTLFNFDQALTAPVRRLDQPGPVRREGAAAELREHPGPVRGLHRPLDQQAHPVHRHDLLAGQQGLAEPAVEPLQQRRRPGRSLFRRAGGQPEPARVLRPGQPHRQWTT